MHSARTTSFLLVCASVTLAAPAHAGRKERRFFRLTEQAQERFDAEGISIPYPQRDVHMHQVEITPAASQGAGSSSGATAQETSKA